MGLTIEHKKILLEDDIVCGEECINDYKYQHPYELNNEYYFQLHMESLEDYYVYIKFLYNVNLLNSVSIYIEIFLRKIQFIRNFKNIKFNKKIKKYLRNFKKLNLMK